MPGERIGRDYGLSVIWRPQRHLSREPHVSSATLSSNLADASSRIQDKAADAFRAGRIATADGLDSAASSLNSGGDRVADLAHSTADSLKASAKYVRRHDGSRIVDDIESLIREHPGKALLGAAVLGFFAGRVFRRD
jgi:ElaB/YqjD/DUF883 family membrane-anchored ribosome-binding protein